MKGLCFLALNIVDKGLQAEVLFIRDVDATNKVGIWLYVSIKRDEEDKEGLPIVCKKEEKERKIKVKSLNREV